MARVYRKDFLTKTRYVTTNLEKAKKSLFQYSELEKGKYGLSVLGMINGVLMKFTPFVLYMFMDNDGSNRISEYKFMRRFK